MNQTRHVLSIAGMNVPPKVLLITSLTELHPNEPTSYCQVYLAPPQPRLIPALLLRFYLHKRYITTVRIASEAAVTNGQDMRIGSNSPFPRPVRVPKSAPPSPPDEHLPRAGKGCHPSWRPGTEFRRSRRMTPGRTDLIRKGYTWKGFL